MRETVDILYPLASTFFFFWVIRNIFFWVALWQLKEYRIDRLFVHLLETGQGRNLLFSLHGILKWLAIVFYIPTVFNEQLLLPYHFYITGIFLLEGLNVFKEIAYTIYKKPDFTFKALFIIVATLSLSVILYFFPIIDNFLWLIILDRLVTIFIAIVVFFLSFPTEIHRDMQIEKAMKKLAKLKTMPQRKKPLLVIGVTGSYGKSSTKHYIAQVLGTAFTTVSTPGTFNTPIGIAHTILKKLKPDTEVFVVEMGAYGKGEISYMSQIVQPSIGILTAVNEQHLSLFKSIQTTMQAKYELIQALPKNGLALFNGTNANVYKLYKQTKTPKRILYKRLSVHQKEIPPVKEPIVIGCWNVMMKETGLSFDVFLQDKITHFETNLIGEHNAENILPAIYIALELGMDIPAIVNAVAKLEPLPKTLNRFVINGVTIFDDTFNANPESVLAIAQYLQVYKKKKFLILQPMIELGKKAQDEHYRIAKEIGTVCDYLLITNKNFYSSIEHGIQDSGGSCAIQAGDAKTLAKFLQDHAKKGDVLGFEGKEAEYVLKQFKAFA